MQRPASFDDLKRGSSVCVSGACLTVTTLTEKEMAFDVVPETLRKTSLGEKKIGDRLNLERALPASGRFDGHIVQGHVEGVGVVVSPSLLTSPPGGERDVCVSVVPQDNHKTKTCPSPIGGRVREEGRQASVLIIRPSRDLLPSIVSKGSITLDGVSLTVVDTTKDSFSVALIPTTLRETTLGLLAKGDRVNVETDILGRYVRQFSSSRL